MKRTKKIAVLFAMMFLAIIMVPEKVNAEGEATPIYTAEDLLLMKDNPSGDYILMDDIQMQDIEWKPIDFSGTLDGNGHAILNLTVTETSDSLRTTYDGNYKVYDTYSAGLFGVLEGSTVKNLTLLGERVEVEKDAPCFAAPIAGFSEGSNIENCNIEAYVRLDANSKMFGVGGIVGYGGNGAILDTSTNVTLVCIDHDKENRDEQFMGGAYGAGYIDVNNCHIIIDGYDSDHGYVHDGGLVGMYILYPLGLEYAGYINNTRVEGMITFFEDNTDRRAYCKDFMGEVMNWTYEYVGNSSDFKPNETKDYSTDLLPHYCSGNDYSEEKVDSTCEEFGYTIYTCNECNAYSYKADYNLKAHTASDGEIIIEAEKEKNGLKKGICQNCGSEFAFEYEGVFEEETPTPVVIEEVQEEIEPEPKKKGNDEDGMLKIIFIVGGIVSAALVGGIIYEFVKIGRRRK